MTKRNNKYRINFMQIKVTKLPKSEVEIEGEIEAGVFESFYKKAIEKLGKNAKIDGFRPGKIPENILVANIPEIAILEEMAEMALSENYENILKEGNVDAISRPEIAITKLARNNPLGFKIKTATLPEVKLPDYKKISSSIVAKENKDKNVEVTDEDVENTIMDIRRSRAPKIHIKDAPAPKEGEEVAENLPEFTEEFVKGLGPFESIEDFKTKLKLNIGIEKENQFKERTRLKIVEELIEKSDIEVPEILIEMEVNKIIFKMESDITQMGLKFEDYLKHLNKTVEDLKKEFRTDGEKKAKLALVLNEIAKKEDIKADEAAVANEVAHILEHYKDADPERARAHAENVLTNERIFQFLESPQNS